MALGTVRNLTGGSGGNGADGGGFMTMGSDFMGGTMMTMSDRRTKHNIARVDRHPLGFGLYRFEYRPGFRDRFGKGRKFGVMADEVARVVPDAIARDASGYARVNYARLGIAAA